MIQLCNPYLVAARDEVVCSHNFNVYFSLKLWQVVDDIITTKRLPDRQVMHYEALGDHIEDSLRDIKHLLLTNLNGRLLLSLRLFIGIAAIDSWLLLFLLIILFIVFFFFLLITVFLPSSCCRLNIILDLLLILLLIERRSRRLVLLGGVWLVKRLELFLVLRILFFILLLLLFFFVIILNCSSSDIGGQLLFRSQLLFGRACLFFTPTERLLVLLVIFRRCLNVIDILELDSHGVIFIIIRVFFIVISIVLIGLLVHTLHLFNFFVHRIQGYRRFRSVQKLLSIIFSRCLCFVIFFFVKFIKLGLILFFTIFVCALVEGLANLRDLGLSLV